MNLGFVRSGFCAAVACAANSVAGGMDGSIGADQACACDDGFSGLLQFESSTVSGRTESGSNVYTGTCVAVTCDGTPSEVQAPTGAAGNPATSSGSQTDTNGTKPHKRDHCSCKRVRFHTGLHVLGRLHRNGYVHLRPGRHFHSSN